jgi:hypothetical protein
MQPLTEVQIRTWRRLRDEGIEAREDFAIAQAIFTKAFNTRSSVPADAWDDFSKASERLTRSMNAERAFLDELKAVR